MALSSGVTPRNEATGSVPAPMFIERLKRLNPSLVTAAVRLHQEGALRANTYLLDTPTMTSNTRVIRAEADRLGLSLYAMAKQFGRNRDACDAVVEGGIEASVAVDIQCMEAVMRLGVLRDQGVAIIYISHHLGEVLEVCDTITVLRDGRLQLTGPASDLDLEGLVDAITGTTAADRQHGGETRPPVDRSGVPAIELRGWNLGERLIDIDLVVHPGEVVGVAGLLGSGRSSLLRSIVGLEPDVKGTLLRNGAETRFGSPTVALGSGVAFVPEDRRRQGMITGQSVQANLLLTMWDRLARHFLISEPRATETSEGLIERLDVRTSGERQLIEFLSGGNQQKVVVGRSLARGPNLLLLDDPTAGIDIGSRRDLLGHVRRFADDGGAVLVVSSELEDLGRIADRVVVLAHGRISETHDRDAGDVLSEANLLTAIHREAGAPA